MTKHIYQMSMNELKEFARRDDCLDQMVPSDLRVIVGWLADLGISGDDTIARMVSFIKTPDKN